jgi:dipeptidyl aminopeptidase/acylaminoacyl peptidase
MRFKLSHLVFVLLLIPVGVTNAGSLQPLDVFELEWASDPRISPDGERIVYVRNSMDVMTDRTRGRLWSIDIDGGQHRPLTSGDARESSPRWSPDGTRLLYVAGEEGTPQLWVRYMDSGQIARLTQLTRAPGGLSWSPDGRSIAFTMTVPEKPEPFVKPAAKPDGATWAEPPRVITKMLYRSDGSGFREDAHRQIFLLSAEGGTPRQVTDGPYDHGTPVWTPDGTQLIFSANRREDSDNQPRNSELYAVPASGGDVRQLTDRYGPDSSPAISSDGKWLAWTGYDDRHQGYQRNRLYIMKLDGSGRREIVADFNRSIQSPRWAADGKSIFFQFNDRGNGKIARTSLSGGIDVIASDRGSSIGRPYGGGTYTLSNNDRFAYSWTRPDAAAEVAVGGVEPSGRLTRLNDDLLPHRELAAVEEIWFESSHDGRRVQGWLATPPGFDASKKYPLILEIHGGPFADYGDRFSAEVQLYAAAGYLVLYINPRGSTSYGEEFGNLIHHAYPGNDYDDLMSGVDKVIARGIVDEQRLFVTGGSGGGVLTAWIVGKTDRFRAAVVAKPVIHWTSFVLTADMYNVFWKYWFPGPPWEHIEHYWKRSPLSLVGNVTTPTMLLSGEEDSRTPISESEQFYQALQLRGVDSALVRIPGASHGIASRPSRLIAKVAHILKWFEMHDVEERDR